MQVIISITKSSNDYNGIFKIDLNTQTIVNSLICDKNNLCIQDNQVFHGITGVTISSDLIYFATSGNIFATDFEFIECKGMGIGAGIHQIDFLPIGLTYCSTNDNVVRYLKDFKPTFYYKGSGGIGKDINHINSLYATDNDCYFVYHNNHNAQPGLVYSMNHGPVVKDLAKPHNVCVNHKGEIIVCDSHRLKISKYNASGELMITSPELNGYTRGLAVAQNGDMIVGSSPREQNSPFITMLNKDFEITEIVSLNAIDDRINGEIYDIRIMSEIDLGLTMHFKYWKEESTTPPES